MDITGQRFGRLVAVSRVGYDKHGQSRWLCQCDCGNTTTVLIDNLRRGYTKSCGCYGREYMRLVMSDPEARAQRLAAMTAGGKRLRAIEFVRRSIMLPPLTKWAVPDANTRTMRQRSYLRCHGYTIVDRFTAYYDEHTHRCPQLESHKRQNPFRFYDIKTLTNQKTNETD